MSNINWNNYGHELTGFRPGGAQQDTDTARKLDETHRRYAAELRAMLAGKPNEWAPNTPGLTPAEATALAEQVVAGQLKGTPGELAVAKAYLAKAKT